MMKQYAPALKHIADIIEKGIREHPGMPHKFTVFLLYLFVIRRIHVHIAVSNFIKE